MADPVHSEIIGVIDALARALDDKDWPAARRCLTDDVDTDYSSFRGTPPVRMTADEYVRLRREGLAGLRTEHRNSDHQLSLEGDEAACRTEFAIHRWSEGDRERFFHSFGHYRYALRLDGGSWRICGIAQTVVRSEGDPTLHGAFR